MEYELVDCVSIPVLGIGTWGGPWGDKTGGGKDPGDDGRCIKAIESALELGINHIDTAELYGDGHAEELIGKAIEGHPRQLLFITSKVRGSNLHRDEISAAVRKSLEHLGTDYLDLYLVHWYNNEVPLSETMEVMCELVDEGLVRNIGVSNFSRDQMLDAQDLSEHKILCNQIEYNLFCRDNGRKNPMVESEVIRGCQTYDILAVAYKPVALGLLSEGRFPELDRAAEKHGKTIYQVALNWAISKKNVAAVFRTNNPEHMKENLGALGWQLDNDDMRELDMLVTRYPNAYYDHIIRTKGRI